MSNQKPRMKHRSTRISKQKKAKSAKGFFASPEITAVWKAEIARRIKEIDEGRAVLLTEEEVEDRLRKKFGPLAD